MLSVKLLLHELLPGSLPSQGLLEAPLLARFQIVGMTLDILDDVLLLHLSLEAPEGAFQGLTIMNEDVCHFVPPFWEAPI